MNPELNYLRGMFVAYEPGGYPDKKREIPFRFNPESLSRQLSVEQAQAAGGTEGAQPAGGGAAGDGQAADAAAGPTKESFSVQIRLDFADRLEAIQELPEEYGVAPEIAAIEDLLYPVETEAAAASGDAAPVQQRQPRPTVLFVWGRKRILPVRITSITVNETDYNTELYPVRAEIDVSLEVMGEADARENDAVKDALSFTAGNRRQMAQMFYERTADQASTILPL